MRGNVLGTPRFPSPTAQCNGVPSYPASLGDRFFLGAEKILFGGVSSDGAVCVFRGNNCRRHAGEKIYTRPAKSAGYRIYLPRKGQEDAGISQIFEITFAIS